jgi:hypothetical protein
MHNRSFIQNMYVNSGVMWDGYSWLALGAAHPKSGQILAQPKTPIFNPCFELSHAPHLQDQGDKDDLIRTRAEQHV